MISGDQNGSIKLYDIGTSKCINDIIPDSHSSSTSSLGRVAIQSVDVSNDTLVAGNNHAEVFVWDPNDATKTTTTINSGGTTTTAPIRPKAKFRAHSYGSYLLHAKISPDGRHLVTTSSDKTARLFDTTTWQLTQTLSQHTKWVWDAVFSADSSYLVTASSDKTARLWNLRSNMPVRQYTDHNYAVTCVALNDSST
jgi:G protein beta subunit-like protein